MNAVHFVQLSYIIVSYTCATHRDQLYDKRFSINSKSILFLSKSLDQEIQSSRIIADDHEVIRWRLEVVMNSGNPFNDTIVRIILVINIFVVSIGIRITTIININIDNMQLVISIIVITVTFRVEARRGKAIRGRLINRALTLSNSSIWSSSCTRARSDSHEPFVSQVMPIKIREISRSVSLCLVNSPSGLQIDSLWLPLELNSGDTARTHRDKFRERHVSHHRSAGQRQIQGQDSLSMEAV